MYEKLLAVSNETLMILKQESNFLVGNIFYLPQLLKETDEDEELINQACAEIVNYLTGMLHCVDEEQKIADAIMRYLYQLVYNTEAFKVFDESPECELFRDILQVLEQSRIMRIPEYMWHTRNYKNYGETNKIANNYKIIGKKKTISDDEYREYLKSIPKK